MHPLQGLEADFFAHITTRNVSTRLSYYLAEFVGRPTPLYFAERLTQRLFVAKIYLKGGRTPEPPGAHKSQRHGQILLAKRMGKTRIIAETGAGQHGGGPARGGGGGGGVWGGGGGWGGVGGVGVGVLWVLF